MIDRAAFSEARRTGIGATDAAAILGLSPYGTPLSVYHDKVDPIEAPEPTLPMWLGLRLEDVVAELFTARDGRRVRADNVQHRHPEDPWLVCHLDYRVLGYPDELVECKVMSRREGWGDEMTDEVPTHYWVQCQHEMLVTGAKVVWLAVLFGTREFALFRVERSEEFLTEWRKAAKEFWHDHVLAEVPPPLEGDEFSRKVVSRRHPAETDGDLRVLPPERELLVLRLRDELAALDKQQGVVEVLKNRVRDLIGESAGITGSWGKVTWKTTKDARKVDWEHVADTYKAALREVLRVANPGDDEEQVRTLATAQSALDAAESLFTSTVPGYRRLDIRFKEKP